MLPIPQDSQEIMSIERSMLQNQNLDFQSCSSQGSISHNLVHKKLIQMARHFNSSPTNSPQKFRSMSEISQKSDQFLKTPHKIKESKISRSSGKAFSTDKQGVEFSLSSDPADLREENEGLSQRLAQVTTQLQNMIEMEKEAKFQALFFKKKMQMAEEKLGSLSKKFRQVQDQNAQYEDLIGKLRLEIQERQTKQEQLVSQIDLLKDNFQRAKSIGQTQIDSLLTEIRTKDQQLSRFQTGHQSAHQQAELVSYPNLSQTDPGVLSSKESPTKNSPSKNFLDRFYSFSREIDRKMSALNKHTATDQQVSVKPFRLKESPKRSSRSLEKLTPSGSHGDLITMKKMLNLL